MTLDLAAVRYGSTYTRRRDFRSSGGQWEVGLGEPGLSGGAAGAVRQVSHGGADGHGAGGFPVAARAQHQARGMYITSTGLLSFQFVSFFRFFVFFFRFSVFVFIVFLTYRIFWFGIPSPLFYSATICIFIKPVLVCSTYARSKYHILVQLANMYKI